MEILMTLDAITQNFYRDAMDVLNEEGIPFLVGGAFALGVYTGIERDTKDFDLMMRGSHVPGALDAFQRRGFRAGIVFSHWLAKVHLGQNFVDIIYSSGNGLCPVDDEWFQAAQEAHLWGAQVLVSPPEELIWQKAYIMERERYDGADVAHLLAHCAERMDWARLERRFEADWRVLLSHLVLFGYIYPSKRSLIPQGLWTSLLRRASEDRDVPGDTTCQGTFLSRAQYLEDVERRGFADARRSERCQMTDGDIRAWTDAIPPHLIC